MSLCAYNIFGANNFCYQRPEILSRECPEMFIREERKWRATTLLRNEISAPVLFFYPQPSFLEANLTKYPLRLGYVAPSFFFGTKHN